VSKVVSVIPTAVTFASLIGLGFEFEGVAGAEGFEPSVTDPKSDKDDLGG